MSKPSTSHLTTPPGQEPGVDPQGKGTDIPCPACAQRPPDFKAYRDAQAASCRWRHGQEAHEHANFSQTVCAVCSTQHDLKDLVGTCPQCREAKTVLDAWQEAFGTSQLTHAMAENQAYGKALTKFQNDTWASLDRYSKALGWGIAGMQPECWALLDSAVDELVAKRELIHDLRKVLALPDRCTDRMIVDAVQLTKDIFMLNTKGQR